MSEMTTGENPVLSKTPKSVSLSSPEMEFIEKHTETFKTEVEAAFSLGIDRGVLNRLILKHKAGQSATCSADKAQTIRKHISQLGFLEPTNN